MPEKGVVVPQDVGAEIVETTVGRDQTHPKLKVEIHSNLLTTAKSQ